MGIMLRGTNPGCKMNINFEWKIRISNTYDGPQTCHTMIMVIIQCLNLSPKPFSEHTAAYKGPETSSVTNVVNLAADGN